MRSFGCPVTILNTIDHLGKFDGKADEGFFVGYSLNSKAFRVFNSRTRIVEENLHIRFSESTPNVVGSGPDWLFDIDALTKTINYEPIIAGTQSNSFAGTQVSDNVGQARKETEPIKNYILLPLWTADLPYSQNLKSSHDDGSKPSSDDGKKVDKDPRKDSECKDQEKEDNVNSTNTVNVAGTNEVNVIGGKTSIELPFDPNMHALEDYSIFDYSNNDEDDGVEADMNNLDSTIQLSFNKEGAMHCFEKLHALDISDEFDGRHFHSSFRIIRKAKKSVRLMMEKLFGMELELILFWSTVKAKNINREVQLHALVDSKKIIVTEASVRRDLQLKDAE
ncbi:ribonuclease H-like domain-containing protein, partial [Tanacetum coccineum]